MSIRDKVLILAGIDNLSIDERITTSYIIRLCIKYGFMMIHGRFFSFGWRKISSSVFVGKKVKIVEKKYLSIGAKTKIHDGVFIDALSSDGILIGNNCVIGDRTIMKCMGGLQDLGKGIKIGDRTTFNNDCLFGAAGGITIGNDVVAGQYVRFHSENHNFDDLNTLIKNQGVSHKGIIIGDNCWIGSGAVFLDGAELGKGCVVGANAVVTKSFPENSVIGGVPARIIRERGR